MAACLAGWLAGPNFRQNRMRMGMLMGMGMPSQPLGHSGNLQMHKFLAYFLIKFVASPKWQRWYKNKSYETRRGVGHMIASFISLAKTFALPFSACANFIGSSTNILKLYNYIMKHSHTYTHIFGMDPKGAIATRLEGATPRSKPSVILVEHY